MQFSVTIPQIFYDLIARMVPGYLFLLMLSYELSGTGVNILSINKLSSNSLLIVLFVLSYGVMSYVMGWVLRSLSFLSAEKKVKKVSESDLEFKKITVPISEMYQKIRIKDEAVGFRILKLRAEARMLESSRTGMFYISCIAVTLILLNILDLLPRYNNSVLEWIVKIVIPVILTLAFWRREHHAWENYYGNIFSHYKILFTTSERLT